MEIPKICRNFIHVGISPLLRLLFKKDHFVGVNGREGIKIIKIYEHFVKAMSPGGTYLEKGDIDVWQTRPPFSDPSSAPQNPLFSIFQFHKTSFLAKNHKIFKFPQKKKKKKKKLICQFFMFPSLKIS